MELKWPLTWLGLLIIIWILDKKFLYLDMEKQGEIVKLINDYNTAGVLEINIKDHWYRTTTRYFR